MSLAFISHSDVGRHDNGWNHPEHVGRIRAITRAMRYHPELFMSLEHVEGRHATVDELALGHDRDYIERVRAASAAGGARFDADTVASEGSWDAATAAAGSVIEAVERSLDGRNLRSFVAVRPPGHHALRDQAMGFCLFGSVAIGALWARSRGVERVLIVDWDVHHGNGTQHIFYGQSDVLVINAHQFPFYPGTGAAVEAGRGEGEGYTVNLALPARLGDGDYVAAFERVVVPIADRFRPDLVLVSAGFDAHRDDPLGEMLVTEEGYAKLTSLVQSIAHAHAGGRLALFLEGGYDLGALSRSVRAVIDVLAGGTAPSIAAPSARGEAAIDETRAVHASRWKV